MKHLKLILPIVLLIASGCGTPQKNKPSNDDQVKTDQSNQNLQEPSSISDGKNSSGYNNKGDANQNEEGIVTSTNLAGTNAGLVITPDAMSSSAAYSIGDTSRKMIKTADLRFRVKSVLNATYEVEDITKKFGGFVTHTHLDSKIDNMTVVPVSPDSSLETVYFTVTNSMTIRVPENKLDSTLRAFTPLVEYLDHRTIDVKDITLELLAKQLERNRIKIYEDRMKKNIDTKGKDLGQIGNAEDMLLNRQAEADNARIESLRLKDQMEYSTITLFIYQRQEMKRELIFNNKNIEGYEPGFGYKLKHSLNSGLKGVKSIILLMVTCWPLLLLGAIAFGVVKLVQRNLK